MKRVPSIIIAAALTAALTVSLLHAGPRNITRDALVAAAQSLGELIPGMSTTLVVAHDAAFLITPMSWLGLP